MRRLCLLHIVHALMWMKNSLTRLLEKVRILKEEAVASVSARKRRKKSVTTSMMNLMIIKVDYWAIYIFTNTAKSSKMSLILQITLTQIIKWAQ